MKNHCLALLFLFTFLLSTHSQEVKLLNWCSDKPLRLIQTNLREIDIIDFDVDQYVKDIEQMGANTVLVNVGGIVANYPSDLDYQYVNTYLMGDILSVLIDRLHQNNIRVIGRFDFSKLNENIAKNHPEWAYVSLKGEQVNYNGQVHQCLNGVYRQEKKLKILEEAIEQYPLDGIFFNMPGYQTSDYSHNYHGICQSDVCRLRFREWSGGYNLPIKEDKSDSVFLKYDAFRKYTANELFEKVNAFVQEKDPNLCICTYVDKGVHLRRMESASHISQTHAFGYQSTNNIKPFLGSFSDRQVSNAAVHFMSFAFRHAAVSANLTEKRLVQNMFQGSGLDFYCIGRLDNQEDRSSLKKVGEVFQFHKQHEQYFTHVRSQADICVLTYSTWHAKDPIKGFVRFLSENHFQFDMLKQSEVDHEELSRPLENYKLIIVPDISNLSVKACARLDAFVKKGGKLLCTGFSSINDKIGNSANEIQLKSLGVEANYSVLPKQMGTYFKISEADKRVFHTDRFEATDLVYMHDDLMVVKPLSGSKTYLSFINSTMFGPPEKCYYTNISEIPGLIYTTYGEGSSVFFPWRIGAHYSLKSHHGHAALLLGAIHDLLGYVPALKVDGNPLIEISYQEQIDEAFGWFGLLNHSGQIGTALHAPLPVFGIDFLYKTEKKVRQIKLLKASKIVKFEQEGEYLKFTVPKIDAYEMVVLEYE